jgi:hypothetical protein
MARTAGQSSTVNASTVMRSIANHSAECGL